MRLPDEEAKQLDELPASSVWTLDGVWYPLSSIHLLEDQGRIIVVVIHRRNDGVNKIMASLGRRKKFYCSFCGEGPQILRHTRSQGSSKHPHDAYWHTGTTSCLTLLRRRNAAREQSLPKAAEVSKIILSFQIMPRWKRKLQNFTQIMAFSKKQITPFHEQKNNVKHPLGPSSNHGFTWWRDVPFCLIEISFPGIDLTNRLGFSSGKIKPFLDG